MAKAVHLGRLISVYTYTQSVKGPFGGATGLGLWLGKSSENVLGAISNFVCVAVHQRHYRSPGQLGRTQLAAWISRLCL